MSPELGKLFRLDDEHPWAALGSRQSFREEALADSVTR
jgi:hypothetical protein